MLIKYIPTRDHDKLIYYFNGDKISVIYDEVKTKKEMDSFVTTKRYTDTFDFSNMPDGVLENVETVLPINPIRSAKCENGVLFIELLHFIGADATVEERFPDWMEVCSMAEKLPDGVCSMAEIKWKIQEEIDEEKLEQMLIPTKEEIDKAKRELEILEISIDILKDLGVI